MNGKPLIEPDASELADAVTCGRASNQVVLLTSIAISLKRLADMFEEGCKQLEEQEQKDAVIGTK